jgi:hypothetical protein
LNSCLRVGLPVEQVDTAAGALNRRKGEEEVRDSIVAAILVHAQVYSFTHRFLLSELAELALERLTQVLIIVERTQARLIPYLADATRLIYNTTPSNSVEENPARKWLSQFVALRYTMLSSEDLDALMAEGGDFVIDVLYKLARRLMTSPLEERIEVLVSKVWKQNKRKKTGNWKQPGERLQDGKAGTLSSPGRGGGQSHLSLVLSWKISFCR